MVPYCLLLFLSLSFSLTHFKSDSDKLYVGIHEEAELVQEDFKIYSNPNTSRIMVSFQSTVKGKALILFYFSDGKLLKREQVNVNKGQNSWEYKLPKTSIGIYIVEFKMDNIQRSGKVFKSGKKS